MGIFATPIARAVWLKRYLPVATTSQVSCCILLDFGSTSTMVFLIRVSHGDPLRAFSEFLEESDGENGHMKLHISVSA